MLMRVKGNVAVTVKGHVPILGRGTLLIYEI